MCDVVYNYFSGLFSSKVTTPDENVLTGVQRLVTQDMKRVLLAVKMDMLNIGDLKASGLDGYKRFLIKGFGTCLEIIS
jgi:hypothetical protein